MSKFRSQTRALAVAGSGSSEVNTPGTRTFSIAHGTCGPRITK